MSCHREELKFRFKTVNTECEAIGMAVELAISESQRSKVLIYGTTVNICEMIGERIKEAFTG